MRCPSSFAGFAFGLAAVTAGTPALSQTEPRAVVELFTSQGCSSCPAADKLIGELAKDPSLITLSMSVDYWDYLGWKDTLALKGHTQRQKGYANTRGDRQVYTPQVVINGVSHVVGSDRAEIEKALSRVRPREALSVPVGIFVGQDGLTVSVQSGSEAQQAGDVWLCLTAREVHVKINKGENRGKEVTYHNVVRRWVKLGTWAGGAQTWKVPKSDLAADNPDAATVLVQTGGAESPGTMLGAATASLR
ncbi:hypothetical protein GJW-30_1_01196 [Variibacter gotjawalensis]|uniref:DUF1223 domain-containing protein n=1 Tax=Variibacter gotjawalensis TaxID=1333996 RepID=A0A0S3PS03_9BRAD|nr:DUF1223 domain-containing protein [Variibacter gotjawalensis]NIK48979.1 hypothetical protein [Variibacter gotjawalensis]RZS50835.1 hypothetical protein EV661_3306 [Variibacter gotjawalensis]BAT58669.1 hypothetical protein GJW-30_1_01196 [Variibacter gotjawalensis]